MATLVKFIKDKENNEIVAVFPQLHWNRALTLDTVTSYAHVGQHSPAHKDWIKEQNKANESEYMPLLKELESIGYKLKVLNEN